MADVLDTAVHDQPVPLHADDPAQPHDGASATPDAQHSESGNGAAAVQPPPTPVRPLFRPAAEPTCCGSGCDDCPF